ncbi:TetR/AcrR family transcriptional regulator [Bacillus sp. FJAT-42315]|uniref:TetR/AcrR family transcriptional regulator n=1 Tax=Bacillus sp. FJAT-42315 TaxID=2014077 RepID=UPI000C23A0E3|nr:TetR/AcrR family transcriptional regulator [Bacillus sp. FJAT-42315]
MKRKRESSEIKKEIIDAARQLFLEEGYQHVSMRKIASKIGYTPTTIYIYFKNKEEILLHLLEEGYSLFYHELKIAYDHSFDQSHEIKLFNMCEAYIYFGLKQPDYYNIIFTKNLETNTSRIENSNRFNGFLLLNTVVKGFIQENTFIENSQELVPSDMNVSHTIWASLHGLTSLLITFPQFDWGEQNRLIQFHIRTIIQGIKN